MKNATIGMPILYFPSGAATPFAGTVAGVSGTPNDNRINIAYTDGNGVPHDRQGVPYLDKPAPGGDYVVAFLEADSTAAIRAHAEAMRKAFQGQPAPRATPVPKGGPAPGDFTSAALSPQNAQPAGSGGPFDPANTALAHMSEHQRQESQSVGNPTTGGMTPTLNAGNLHNVSERDRETAKAILGAKGDDEKAKLARGGTGVATRGTAEMIATGKGLPPAPDAPAAGPVAIGFGQANEEVTRIERQEQLHDEAVEKSKQITAERAKDKLSTAGPTEQRRASEKVQRTAAKAGKAAKKMPARKAVKKAPSKKVPAKKSKR